MAVSIWCAFYEASRLKYVPTPRVFAYLNGINKACLNDAGRVSMIALTENLLMSLACFFTACPDGHSSQAFGYLQLDRHQGGFIFPFPMGILADLDVAGQYRVLRKAGFDRFLSSLAVQRSSKVDRDSYVGMENPFLGYVSSLPPLRVAKRQRSSSEALVFIIGRDVLWLSGLAYASKESCRAYWRAANGEVTNVLAEAEVPCTDVPDMDDLALLLEKDAGWTQDVGSVDPRRFEMWGEYQGELAALKL